MKYKAVYKYKTYENGYPLYWYEYRNKLYCVAYNTEESCAYQHRYEQEKIDADIELSERMNKLKCEPAEVGFKKFWDYIDG